MAAFKKKKEEQPIYLDENTKEFYRFDYKLTYEEAYAAFSLLAFKWSHRYRIIAGVGLTGIAVALLIFFALDPQKIHFFFMAAMAVLLLFYLIYVPTLKARRGAKAVVNSRGTFKVEIRDIGTISMPHAEAIDLAGDKDSRAIETEDLFVIRPNSGNTFCIPKRVMKPDEIEGVRDILGAYIKLVRQDQ
ncbi:MAG: YcxB family protein [Eubacterium sp.]|nr:YcxB family protein [Eubacterium sp.]